MRTSNRLAAALTLAVLAHNSFRWLAGSKYDQRMYDPTDLLLVPLYWVVPILSIWAVCGLLDWVLRGSTVEAK